MLLTLLKNNNRQIPARQLKYLAIRLIIFFLLLPCLSPAQGTGGKKLKVVVSTSDSTGITGAEVWLNGEKLTTEGSGSLYVKTGFVYNKNAMYNIRIECKNYPARNVAVKGESIINGDYSCTCYLYLIKNKQRCYISGNDSIPYNTNPVYISAIFDNEYSKEEIDKLIKTLGLERANDNNYDYVLLKRKTEKSSKSGIAAN